jgi:decaprenylphospho-beta-D-ribofuranose 2-oxidase
MIAADIHGKNHHFAGTFSRHLEHFLLMTADGEMRSCRPGMNDDLFNATCGGMGLTGIIVEATIRLVPVASSAIRQETLRSAGLEETFALCEASADWTYTVAWIDCLKRGANFGRGIVYRGVHAGPEEGGEFRVSDRPTYHVPFDFPGCLLNSVTMQVFNELYYQRAKPGQAIIDYDRFFFPLDSIADWNRSYGRKGFAQYQCVIPKNSSNSAIRTILDRVSSCGAGSFLAVLKLFGEEGGGFLSFPMEGYTLTLDFPIRIETFTLLRELDAVVIDHGGRLYLAKDARASAAMLKRGYPRIDRFIAVRDRVDPRRKFTSLQSSRLGL